MCIQQLAAEWGPAAAVKAYLSDFSSGRARLDVSKHPDAGMIYQIMKNWPERRIKAICVTDGERVGHLGDLGVQVCSCPVCTLTSVHLAVIGSKRS